VTPEGVAEGALASALPAERANALYRPNGMYTMSQARYFAPRTLGAVGRFGRNMRSMAVGAGASLLAGTVRDVVDPALAWAGL